MNKVIEVLSKPASFWDEQQFQDSWKKLTLDQIISLQLPCETCSIRKICTLNSQCSSYYAFIEKMQKLNKMSAAEINVFRHINRNETKTKIENIIKRNSRQ